MTGNEEPDFNTEVFLSTAGLGRTIVKLNPKDTLFVQGDATRFVFFLQKGRAKLTVVSPLGKEATISLLSPGEFIGEESMTPVVEHHTATAVAITAWALLH
jgi:CRP/FNR family transcriptional regulator, cyclic AMP receptor protein